MLERRYDEVDAISLPCCYGNGEETGGDTTKHLAMNLAMNRQIEEGIAVCDLVRGRWRTDKTVWLWFDECTVWNCARGRKSDDGHREEAPHLPEDVYNLEDTLLVGGCSTC